MRNVSRAIILLIFCTNLSFAGTLVESTAKCPAHELLTAEESNENLALVDNKDQEELLKKYDLLPSFVFKHNNAEIILSKRFSRPDKDRYHAIGYIKIDGVVYPRVFYHSNSHGTFRAIDGVLDGWYSKGPGQAFISIPFKITKFLLNGCTGDGPKRFKKELAEMLAKSDDHLYYFNNYGVFEDNVSPGLEEATVDLILDGNGSSMRNPADLAIKHGFEPDFTNEILSFNAETKAAGPVKVFVYRSINEKLEYMVMQGEDKKIWIAEINTFGEDLNKFGIANKQFDLGDLLQPRWEYPNEIAVDFKSPNQSPYRSKYYSNWNYLREVPVIKSWYSSKGISLPEKE
jgi:hypothetical protein